MKYRNNGYFIFIHGNNASLATKKVYDYRVYESPCGYYTKIIQVLNISMKHFDIYVESEKE